MPRNLETLDVRLQRNRVLQGTRAEPTDDAIMPREDKVQGKSRAPCREVGIGPAFLSATGI
jgi:hypothetical protein